MTTELESLEPHIACALRRFQDDVNALSPDDIVAVIEAATSALRQSDDTPPPVVAALAGGRTSSPAERVATELAALTRSFARRRELLADALSTAQVAKLLHTSLQTPHDRVAAGTLLGVMNGGGLRFRAWQFDAGGENGVMQGLPAVLRALDASPLAKANWLTRRNEMLDGETPLHRLTIGQAERVVTVARGVGVA